MFNNSLNVTKKNNSCQGEKIFYLTKNKKSFKLCKRLRYRLHHSLIFIDYKINPLMPRNKGTSDEETGYN